MSKKQRQTLDAIFTKPDRANILWDDIEDLFIGLGAKVSYGSGSIVRVILSDVVAVFHRPHPQKETYKSAERRVRRYLIEAGIGPDAEV